MRVNDKEPRYHPQFKKIMYNSEQFETHYTERNVSLGLTIFLKFKEVYALE